MTCAKDVSNMKSIKQVVDIGNQELDFLYLQFKFLLRTLKQV